MGITSAIVSGTFLGVTSIGLFADLKVKVNTLMEELPRLNNLELTVKDIETIVTDVIENLEILSERQADLQETMDIYMFLGQTFNKLTEVQTAIIAFIQDLVLENSS